MTFARFKKLLKSLDRAGEVLQCRKCTDQWITLTKAYLGLGSLSFPFEFRTRQGQKITLNTFHDLVTVWVIFCRHEYKVPSGSEVIIDAGANIGTFSIYASQNSNCEIFAIEPFPETFSQLQKNIEANDLQNKVHLNPVALASESGQRNMDLEEAPSQSRGLLAADDPEGLQVTTLTLEDFIQSTQKEEIDLLKIDIEGGEHEVFLSSSDETLRKIKHIAMEYHPNKPKAPLFDRIQKAKFHLSHDFRISDASGVAYFARQ